MGKIDKTPFIILMLLVFLFGSASIFKSSGILGNKIHSVEIAINGAIYLHLFASLLLGTFCRLATKHNICLGLPPTTILLVLLVTIDESLQFFIPLRQFSWLDMLVNIFGVLTGTYIMNMILRLRSYITTLFQ